MKSQKFGKIEDIDFGKIKIVVFDFDYTLYSGDVGSGYLERFYKFFIDEGIAKSEGEAERKIGKFLSTYKNNELIEGVLDFCKINNIDTQKLIKFDSDNFFKIDAKSLRAFDNKYLECLKKYYKLYMISDSPLTYLKYNMKKLHYDIKNFEKIYTNNFDAKDYLKTNCYKKLLEETGESAENIVMIGDNYIKDIVCSEELGFQTYLTQDVEETKNFVVKLLEAKNAKID